MPTVQGLALRACLPGAFRFSGGLVRVLGLDVGVYSGYRELLVPGRWLQGLRDNMMEVRACGILGSGARAGGCCVFGVRLWGLGFRGLKPYKIYKLLGFQDFVPWSWEFGLFRV